MIYCANCLLCKVFTNEKGFRRVRCKADQWTTPQGHPKTYSFHTVLARFLITCEFYASMGEPNQYLKDLAETLPVTKEFDRVGRGAIPGQTQTG